jgi:hypothetical protein
MKRYLFPGLMILLLVLCLGCASRTYDLVGAWEMVSSNGEPPPAAGERASPDNVMTKILTDGHFAFGGTTPGGGVWAGGGRYLFDGETYTEIIEYHSLPELVGLSLEFQCRLEDDLWYHSGRFQVDGQWIRIDEIWRRIED